MLNMQQLQGNMEWEVSEGCKAGVENFRGGKGVRLHQAYDAYAGQEIRERSGWHARGTEVIQLAKI
jgi:hypothetical protein